MGDFFSMIGSMRNLYNRQYFIHSIIVFIIMNVFFWGTVGDISSSGKLLFVRKSMMCAIALYIAQFVVRQPFFHRRWLANFLFMGWWYSFAVIKYFAIDKGGAALYENEIFIGTYGTAAFIVLQYYFEKYINESRALLVADAFQLLLCLPPVITYVHYWVYGYPIIYEEMLAVYNTNYKETIEWCSTYMGWGNVLLIAAGIMGIYAFLHFFRVKMSRKYDIDIKPRNPYIVLLVVAALLYYPLLTLSKTDCVGHFFLAAKYSRDIKNYSQDISEKYNSIQFVNNAQVCDSPHTIIMMIGESACRDLMKAYNTDYPYDNTPWLSQCKDNDDFIVYTNAYACQSLTQQVLQNALTEKSYYNDKSFLEAMNIIDVAKKKGYKTYWITNLGGEDGASAFSLIADRADSVIHTNGEYDDSMLDGLKQIDSNENNFIILHGRGTHAAYAERYPKEKAVFEGDSREAEYSNALLYVDTFLKNVYNYGSEHLNLQVMVYYSDHGENLQTGHGPSDHSFDKVRIPMFIYMGNEYQNKNRDKFQYLLSRKDSFYTNDMIYNTLCGILNAESNYYDAGEDFSSAAYKYHLEDLWTFGREVKVARDPFLNK